MTFFLFLNLGTERLLQIIKAYDKIQIRRWRRSSPVIALNVQIVVSSMIALGKYIQRGPAQPRSHWHYNCAYIISIKVSDMFRVFKSSGVTFAWNYRS